MKDINALKKLLEDIFEKYPQAAEYEQHIIDLAKKILELDGEEVTDDEIAGVLESIAYSLRAEKAGGVREHGSPLAVTFRRYPETREQLEAAYRIVNAQFEQDNVEDPESDDLYAMAIPLSNGYAVGNVDLCGDLVIDFVSELPVHVPPLSVDEYFG